MVADLRKAALRRAGLELRVPECTRSPVQMRGQDATEHQGTKATHPNFAAMNQSALSQCLRILGTFAQCDGVKDREYADRFQAGWTA